MKLSKYIDNTLLKPAATEKDIQDFALKSLEYDFAAICILPGHIEYVRDILRDSGVRIATVVGFPLGLCTTKVKEYETENAILLGAQEIDMVINISWAQDKKFDHIKEEIRGIKKIVKTHGDEIIIKVIIETCYLNREEIRKISQICKEVGVDYVKTSTGFGTSGASVEDVVLIKETLGEYPKIKASGGIRSYEDAKKFIEAGATRLGTSNGFQIVDDSKRMD